MREQNGTLHAFEYRASCTAEEKLPQSRMTIGAHDKQADLSAFRSCQKSLSRFPRTIQINCTNLDAVPQKSPDQSRSSDFEMCLIP